MFLIFGIWCWFYQIIQFFESIASHTSHIIFNYAYMARPECINPGIPGMLTAAHCNTVWPLIFDKLEAKSRENTWISCAIVNSCSVRPYPDKYTLV